MSNLGKYYEFELINALDNKKVKNIEPNYVYVLERLYGPLNKRKKIYCRHADKFIKPDVIITYEGIEKAISLKTGTACEVHRENVRTFIPFLRNLGISKNIYSSLS